MSQGRPIPLLPRPARLELGPGVFAVPQPLVEAVLARNPGAAFRYLIEQAETPEPGIGEIQVRLEPVGELGIEAYRLTLRGDAGASQLLARDAAGARHGLATLAQLIRQYGRRLPAMVIEDAPVFPTRGVMLDVSRCRVPTMASLHELVGLLASMKINHLQLYTEHTFAYAGHEEVWRDCSPMTADEVRQLDAWCREVGITLAANQNCFGHLHRWLALPRYAPLAETTGAWDFLGTRRQGGFSLCPGDPRSIELISDLLEQLLPQFSSGLVNIGCDETLDVGQGRSRAEVARRGWRVYAEFVGRVAQLAVERGFRPMFWADIALSHPESLETLPAELIALAWGYEPDAPFTRWGGALQAAGREWWVCPGTSSWRSITGRTSERVGNIKAAAGAGLACGASGLLVTDWGDLGHRQQWPISLRGIADAADAAWSGWRDGACVPEGVSMHAFGDASGRVAQWLDEIGQADFELRSVCGPPDPDGRPTLLRNATALLTDLDRPLSEEPLGGPEALWCDTRDRVSHLAGRVPSGAGELVAAELAHTAEVALIAAERAIARRRPGGMTADRADDLADRLRVATNEHRRLWLIRSRPGGLDESCSHYERTIRELQRVGQTR
ncbi:MAG: family 20 glycosylhydrolase [Planctomycetes bacterium]|nr:family 20 glycosylhydrolase [Planctomycetota bacterium]